MRNIKVTLLIAGSLIVLGEISVALADRARNVRGDGIEENATITSTLASYERISLCSIEDALQTVRFVCGSAVAFPIQPHTDARRSNIFVWSRDSANKRVVFADRSLWKESKRPVARLIAGFDQIRELFIGFALLGIALILHTGGERLRTALEDGLSHRGSSAMCVGLLILALGMAVAFGNARREVPHDGIVESRTLTSSLLGYERVRLCAHWEGQPAWECDQPIVLARNLSRSESLRSFDSYRTDYRVHLSMMIANQDKLPKAIWQARIAARMNAGYELAFGLALFIIGLHRAGLDVRSIRRLRAVEWKRHALSVWYFTRHPLTVSIAVAAIGVLLILGAAAARIDDMRNRKAFDGFAERRTATSWMLGFDRVATCHLGQFHGDGVRGYVCDEPTVYQMDKRWKWKYADGRRWRYFSFDKHGPEKGKRHCALGPTAYSQERFGLLACVAAVTSPFHEFALGFCLLLIGSERLRRHLRR